jgi:hypothetical protein
MTPLPVKQLVSQYASGTSIRVLATIHHTTEERVRAQLKAAGTVFRTTPWRRGIQGMVEAIDGFGRGVD